MTKLALATFLLVALLLGSSFFDSTMAGSSFCNSKCAVRCSKAGRKDRCLEYCGICCGKCHCVPSGRYGNKDECPCYRDMKNSKGQPKCP
ncbi:peamaclein-like [Syzygium oleosum]|uniref:peamaclein-like n=1 Tax=Syzygium oleosum TaxID=219896 RepID=UPI0011D181A5|nr:peamaclein-like [Syzygium oleosum]